MANNLSIVELPCDLVEEILCILPVESLLRCKAVCKSWNLLISSHDFIYRHLHRKPPQLGGYPIGEKKEGTSLHIKSLVDDCNGIICLETSSREKPLILCNPSTKEFSFVPLADPGNVFGFCYNPETQEYIVVSFNTPGGYETDITTLTLGKTISSRVDRNVLSPDKLTGHGHITSGTTMYWHFCEHDYGCEHDYFVYYDVIEGRFTEMNLPPVSFLSRCVDKSLHKLKGSVTMLVCEAFNPHFFDIWMLTDDISNGKGWMKYRTVGPFETPVYPIEICWYDSWILCENEVDSSYPLFYYDLETDLYFQCDLLEDYRGTDPPLHGFANYVKSLVSISSLVPCIDTDYPKDCLED